MLNDPTVRRAIIASLVAAAIFWMIIQPGVGYALAILRVVYSAQANAVYANAAFGVRDWVAAELFLLLAALACGFYINVVLGRRGLPVPPRFRPALWVILAITAILAFTSESIRVFADLQLNASFRQRVVVLAPYLSVEEEERLHAMWASMRNRGDYERINEALEQHAQKHRITLPRLLIK